ncbi:hypothetical protein [Pedobacter jamesrossensis]
MIFSDFRRADKSGALRSAGFNGFLIGENFMKTDNPGEAIKDFVAKI